MKMTAQRLSEVYCRPTNEAEWDLCLKVSSPNLNLKMSVNYVLGYVLTYKRKSSFFDNESKGKTEIPVHHFIDLIEDKIVAWRLVEDGFKELAKGVWSWSDDGHQLLITFERELNVMLAYSDQGMIPMCGCETYSDLLTLIRLLK